MPPPPLPDINAPLPDLNGDVPPPHDGSLWSSFNAWCSSLLSSGSSEAFEEEAATTSSKRVHGNPGHEDSFIRQCCNWGNLRTRLLLMCVLDIFGSLYGLASANRVRLISPLLNITGLIFIWLLLIGMCITAIGISGIVQRNSSLVRVFFYWSILALVLNFVLSCIDLTTIDKQCEFIWNNFDHSAYQEKDRQLFMRQCASYAFVFFSVVMVAIAFARLYYVYLIRGFYVSITPEHEAHTRRGYGYAPVHSASGGSRSTHSSYVSTVHEGDEEAEYD